MKTVCILYGFCEGPRMARRLLKALDQAGFTVVNDIHNADVIMAHSGGCFLVPGDVRDKQVIMVGLTHWPGKSILRGLVEKNWNDFHHHRGDRKLGTWAHKFFWNLVYFWNMPRNIRMLQERKRGRFWKVKQLTLVRNEEDSFCTPDLKSLPFEHQPTPIELPGQHDDCWLHPERYVSIVQSVYGKRLLVTSGGGKAAVPRVGVEPAREPAPSRQTAGHRR